MITKKEVQDYLDDILLDIVDKVIVEDLDDDTLEVQIIYTGKKCVTSVTKKTQMKDVLQILNVALDELFLEDD